MKLALKAQNQSRALHTLMQRHQPKQTAFIKQANIAHGHQQVNNRGNSDSSEKNLSQQNQLLAREEIHGSQILDTKTKTTAKRSDSRLETVETGHRTQNSKRKAKSARNAWKGGLLGSFKEIREGIESVNAEAEGID